MLISGEDIRQEAERRCHKCFWAYNCYIQILMLKHVTNIKNNG